MNHKIGIVTVLYRSENVLAEFFESLSIQTYRNFVLYVVDNLSPDNSLKLCEEYKKTANFEMVIIANDDNYGVAKGNNIGIKQALADGCEYILLSNNDVVVHSDAIELTLKGLLRNNADMAVPKIYFYKKNTLWYAGGNYFKYNGWCYHYGMNKEDQGQYNDEAETIYAPTCFLLISKIVFDNVGFMDEAYFVYWDDTDFIFRSRETNYKLFYIPSAIIEHNESSSTGGKNKFTIYYLYRNLVYFSLKNRSFSYALYIVIFNLLVHTIKHLFTWSLSNWLTGYRAFAAGLNLYSKSLR